MFSIRHALCLLFLSFTLALSSGTVRAAEPLKVGYSDWPGWVAWEVAIQKGFFKEEGVDVQFVWFEYGPSMDAFTANKIDAVLVTNGDAMVTGANGRMSTAVLLTDYSNGNDMIVAKPGIGSIKELAGKKVGIELNLVENLLLVKALEANGMKDTDVKMVNVPTNETPQSLSAGGVDAIGAWYPVAGQALKQVAGSKALYTSADLPGLIYDGLYVGRDNLSAHRAEWMKITKVWFKTLAYINDPSTHDEAVKIMAARVQVDPKDYEKSMKGTYLLDLPGNLKAFTKGEGLDSVIGSSKVGDAFNVKAGVYKTAQDIEKYFDASLVNEISSMKKDK